MNMFPAAAVQTLKAKWWELWLAELLGERVEGQDGDCTIVCHRWRGRLYMTDFIEPTR